MSSSTKGSIGGAIALLLSIPFLSILHGWVLTMLWRWFVVPTFHVPELAIIPAIGLGLVVGMFMPEIPVQKKEDEDYPFLTAFLKLAFKPLFILAVGALWHTCQ